MPPRRKGPDNADRAEYAATYRERHGIAPDESFFIPSWRRLPDELGIHLDGRPNLAGWRFEPNGTVEEIRR